MTAPRRRRRPVRRAGGAGHRIAMPLPRVGTNLMAGLMETLAAAPYNGRADLPALAGGLHMEVDDLFPARRDAADAALRRAGGGRHRLTEAGRVRRGRYRCAQAAFAAALRATCRWPPMIRQVLDERPSHSNT